MSQTPSDLTKSPKQLICDLINDANGTAYAPETTRFGAVVAVTDEDYDTDVAVAKDDGRDFDETAQIIHYRRCNLGRMFKGASLPITDDGYQTVHDLLGAIRAAKPLLLTEDDVADNAIPQTGPYPRTVTVTAAPESLVYMGQFTVEITGTNPTPPDGGDGEDGEGDGGDNP